MSIMTPNLKYAAALPACVRIALFHVLTLASMPAEGAQVDDATAIAKV
jgi:hypothetical protein